MKVPMFHHQSRALLSRAIRAAKIISAVKKIRIKVTPNVGAYGGTREARRHTRPPAQCDTLQNAVRNAARRTSVISKKTRVEILCLYPYLLPMR